MTQQERDLLGKALMKSAIFYGKNDFNIAQASLMIDILIENFPHANAFNFLKALDRYKSDHKNTIFPVPARLAPYLKPSISIDDQAKEITSKIIEAISSIGYSNFKGAEAHFGKVGMDVVRRFGGWQYLCQNHGVTIDPGQFFAQCRELVKTRLQHDMVDGIHNERPLQIEQSQKKELPPVTDDEIKMLAEKTKGWSKSEIESFVSDFFKQKHAQFDATSNENQSSGLEKLFSNLVKK